MNNKTTKVKPKDLILFTRNLAVMLKSGLAISEALEINAEQTRGRMRAVLQAINSRVLKGSSLKEAMAGYPRVFGVFYVESVGAGEASGRLEENLWHIAAELEKQSELTAKIKQAMFYPLIVLGLSMVLGVLLAFVVLPKITPIFKGLNIDLPASTRILIWLSELIERQGVWILFVLSGLIAGGIWIFQQKFFKPFASWLWLRIPVIRSIVVNRNLAQFTLILGSLIRSGLGVNEALEVSSKTLGNFYYSNCTRSLTRRTEQGESLANALKDYPRYFPKLCISMVEVGERSGRLDEELTELSRLYEREVDSATKTLATAVEPILLLIIGLVVGGLAISIITPIYKITGNVY